MFKTEIVYLIINSTESGLRIALKVYQTINIYQLYLISKIKTEIPWWRKFLLHAHRVKIVLVAHNIVAKRDAHTSSSTDYEINLRLKVTERSTYNEKYVLGIES